MSDEDHLIEVVEYTDPYCTWCWGAEPVLRKIEELYGEQVKITFKMGGMVDDIAKRINPFIDNDKDRIFDWVAEHWTKASTRHGMPVDGRGFRDIAGEFRSTYPANIAYKAAQMQSQELADRFLRRMREAAAAERRPLHRREIQVELAMDVGLNVEKLVTALEDGSAEKAFSEDLNECRRLEVTGFPTFLVRNRKGKFRLLVGYQRFEEFERIFMGLSEGSMVRNEVETSNSSITAFIQKHSKVATKEVAEVFSLTNQKAEEMLTSLESEGKIAGAQRGTGNFWIFIKNGPTVEVQGFAAGKSYDDPVTEVYYPTTTEISRSP